MKPESEGASCRSDRPSLCRREESLPSCASSTGRNSRTFSTLPTEKIQDIKNISFLHINKHINYSSSTDKTKTVLFYWPLAIMQTAIF